MNRPDAHAEVDAMQRLSRQSIPVPRNMKMIVWRICHDGSISNSKPCRGCVQSMNRSKLNVIGILYSQRINNCAGLIRSTLRTLLNDNNPHVGRRYRKNKHY